MFAPSNDSQCFAFTCRDVEFQPFIRHSSNSCFRAILFTSILAFACAPGLRAAAASQGSSSIVSFDAPDASAAAYGGTVALAIDNGGDVAGVYSDANSVVHGFVRSAAGTFAEFDGPEVNGKPDEATIPIGFDATGDLAGIYVDSTGRTHGFLRAAAGGITAIDAGATVTSGYGTAGDTIPTFIDSAGDVSGVYVDSSQVTHGFVLPFGGKVVTFQAASLTGGTGGNSPGTDYVAVNPSGEAAGTYVDVNDVVHGFLRSASGDTITTIDAPAIGGVANQGTAVTAIDAAGDVAGIYVDSDDVAHGFVRAADGTISTFNAPEVGSGASQSPGIIPFSYPFRFDAAGDLSGVFLDGNDVAYGFIRSASGSITKITAPDAAPMPIPVQNAIARLARQSKIGTKAKSFATRRLPLLRGLSGTIAHKHNLLRVAELSRSASTESVPTEIDGTVCMAINSLGVIAGLYTDSEAGLHSFIRTANNSITEFSAPAAGQGVYQGTVAFAINDDGTVAGTYLDSNSDVHGFIAQLGLVATTVNLTAQPSSSAVYGQPVTLTAQVAAGTATPPDGETVQFLAGDSTLLGSGQTKGGAASLTTTSLSVASDSITAVYTGDGTYAGSTSNAVVLPVGKATSSLSLTSSPNPSTVGQAVSFTATVTGAYGGVATGTVTFYNGSTVLGSGTVAGNQASYSDSSLAAGSYSVTASYGGDSNFQSSNSGSVTQVVNAAPTPGFTLSANPGSLTLQAGKQGTVTLTVTSTGGFSSAVSFACSGLPSGASCAFSPATVTPTAAGAPTTLTISTSATSAASHSKSSPFVPITSIALGACLMGWKRRRGVQWLLLLLVAGAGLACFAGCSAGSTTSSTSTTTSTSSTVTITATSGTVQETATVSLTLD